MERKEAEVKPYTYKELQEMYGISRRSFKTWLEKYEYEIGPKRGRYFNIVQVEIMFRRFGTPRV